MDLTEISRNKVLGPIYSRGWTEAREQGREEGREEGQLALIRRLIQRRFGNLPQEFESRLLQCSGPQLEQLGERVLDASTLDELFD